MSKQNLKNTFGYGLFLAIAPGAPVRSANQRKTPGGPIITDKVSNIFRLVRATGMALAALLFLGTIAGSSAAQVRESKDRDNPIRITSGDVTVLAQPKRELYYSFNAGPGEVTLTVDGLREGRPSFVNADITLFDSDAREIRNVRLRSYIANERVIDRVRFDRRQAVVMRLSVDGNANRDPGTIRVRLGGAIDPGQSAPTPATPLPTTDTNLPVSGVLRIEMKDGSVQEIDLSRLRQITVRP